MLGFDCLWVTFCTEVLSLESQGKDAWWVGDSLLVLLWERGALSTIIMCRPWRNHEGHWGVMKRVMRSPQAWEGTRGAHSGTDWLLTVQTGLYGPRALGPPYLFFLHCILRLWIPCMYLDDCTWCDTVFGFHPYLNTEGPDIYVYRGICTSAASWEKLSLSWRNVVKF